MKTDMFQVFRGVFRGPALLATMGLCAMGGLFQDIMLHPMEWLRNMFLLWLFVGYLAISPLFENKRSFTEVKQK